MNIRRLLEEYLKTFKYRKGTCEIFVNPTRKEMMEVAKDVNKRYYIRFIADPKNKKLYVFDPDVFHTVAAEAAGGGLSSKKTLWGTAIKVGAKWEMEGSDEFLYNLYKLSEFRWVEKYINVSKYFKKMKKQFSNGGGGSTYIPPL